MKTKELNFSKYTPYEVDFEYLEKNVEFFLEAPNENPEKLSFWKIMQLFSHKKILEPADASFLKSFCILCEGGEYNIECKNLIARQVLAVLLNQQNEGKPFECFWYLYDYDSCNETPQFIHSFFLAIDRKIQLNDVQISTSWMDECDQNILIESDSSFSLWSNMEENHKATTLWYYQKFYRETEWGQIISIRENLNTVGSIKSTVPSTSINQALLSSINRKLKFAVIILIGILFKMLF